MPLDVARCVAVYVPDRAEAAAYYERVLGYRRVSETESFTEMETGAARLYLSEDQTIVNPVFDLWAANLRVVERLLVEMGFVRSRRGKAAVRRLRDPFGNVYRLIRLGHRRRPVSTHSYRQNKPNFVECPQRRS